MGEVNGDHSGDGDGLPLDERASDLIARMANHIAQLTLDEDLATANALPGPTAEIHELVTHHHLPTSSVAAAHDREERARSAGILHGLEHVERAYRQGLAEGEALGPSTSEARLCHQIGHHLVEMDFPTSWHALSEARAANSADGQARKPYMEGVIVALRAMVRSVEIQLEQEVLDRVEASRDDPAGEGASRVSDENAELIALLFVALTSATRSRIARALTPTGAPEAVDWLVESGLLEDDVAAGMRISRSGAARARSLLSHSR